MYLSLKLIHNPKINIYVSSIRKSIGVCDGAVILSKEPLPTQYIQEEQKDFADKRFVAQTDKARYTYSKIKRRKVNSSVQYASVKGSSTSLRLFALSQIVQESSWLK